MLNETKINTILKKLTESTGPAASHLQCPIHNRKWLDVKKPENATYSKDKNLLSIHRKTYIKAESIVATTHSSNCALVLSSLAMVCGAHLLWYPF